MDAQAGMLARLFESESESTPIPFTPLPRPRDGLLRMPRPELLEAEVPQRRVDLDPVAGALDVLEGLRRRSLSRLSLRRPSAIWNGLPSAGFFGDGYPMPPSVARFGKHAETELDVSTATGKIQIHRIRFFSSRVKLSGEMSMSSAME